MESPFYIGGQEYDLPASNNLRAELITLRHAALGPEEPRMKEAVVLTHVIGLLHALMLHKWPEYAELSKEFANMAWPVPRYGDAALDLHGVTQNLSNMGEVFEEAYSEFCLSPSRVTWERLNEGVMRMRLLLDVAQDLLPPPEPGETEPGSKP